jgi:hypothetical protein
MKAIFTILNEKIFNGSCTKYKTITCTKDYYDRDVSICGVSKVLEKFIDGRIAYHNISA